MSSARLRCNQPLPLILPCPTRLDKLPVALHVNGPPAHSLRLARLLVRPSNEITAIADPLAQRIGVADIKAKTRPAGIARHFSDFCSPAEWPMVGSLKSLSGSDAIVAVQIRIVRLCHVKQQYFRFAIGRDFQHIDGVNCRAVADGKFLVIE